MIRFREGLNQAVTTILQQTVGVGSDPTDYVKTFDTYLHDVELEELPYLVVNARTMEKTEDGEIGTNYNRFTWTVHLYYLDTTDDDYATADARRDYIIGKIVKVLEENQRLGNLEVVDLTSGAREYVYDSAVTSVLFDSSGQEGYNSFVSEVYLEVYTDRTAT